MKNIMGIDIGGTKCSVVLGRYSNENIEITDKISFSTETELGPGYAMAKLFEAVEAVVGNNGLDYNDISKCGISCGGPLDSEKGMILSPPNLPGWDNVDIVEQVKSRFGFDAYLQNDANACALAEWKFGAGKGFSNVIFLTFGTGLGAGLILNGRLYSGTNDMAGEVGHIRLSDNGPVGYGKAGSFEGFCSGGGIAQLAKTKVMEKMQMGQSVSFCKSQKELDGLTAKKVALSAKSGDPLAIEIYETAGRYLGMGLSVLIDILNPEVIIIGSIFARSKELLYPKAYEIIEKEALEASRNRCSIVPSMLGEQIGDYAALAVAMKDEV